MKNVAIILLNWNQTDYTIQCINSLEKIDYKHTRIYVIDNGSRKEELDKLDCFLSESKLDIYFEKSDVNLGFTGGNNKLLEKVYESDDISHVLLLNNDTEVEPSFLTKLVEKLDSDETYGSIGPLVLNAIDKNIVDSAGTSTIVNLAQGTLIGHGKRREELDIQEKEVQYITGCALLVKFNVMKKVGFLDDTFFAYFEDIDFGVRIDYLGYKNIFYPESVVYHYGSISTGERSEFFYFLSSRNRLIFAKKHQTRLNFYFLFIPYFFIWKIGFKFLTSKNKKTFFKGHFKGLKSYLFKTKIG